MGYSEDETRQYMQNGRHGSWFTVFREPGVHADVHTWPVLSVLHDTVEHTSLLYLN